MNRDLNKEIAGSGKKKRQIAGAMKPAPWHPSKISKIISGAYIPTEKEKRQLAREIGVTVESIFQNQEMVEA
ncbi:MAG: hypothetical protein IH886_00905 [Nitrospinae bacterium]|nr:hypothetical protein [Nitrospinota bacterium]